MTKALKRSIVPLVLMTTLLHSGSAQTNYFLVAAPKDSDWTMFYFDDSYVLPLSKQEDIDHARYLLSLGSAVFTTEGAAPLVGARIGPGRDGINRNYVDREFLEWSWHVIEFLRFADFSAEILDGTPTQVEHDPNWYLGLDGRQGIIGFWAYTVVRELGPVPLYVSAIPEGENLEIYWSGVGTNYLYTLESKESLTSSNWAALPGASWPLKTNHWTVTRTNATARFYHVRAESSNQANLSP